MKFRMACRVGYGVVGLALTVALAHPAYSREWTGLGGDGDWFNQLNWSDEAIPAADEHVVIDGHHTVMLSNSVPASGTLASLTLRGSSSVNRSMLVFTNWNTMLSADDVTIDAHGVLTCAGPFTDASMSNRVWVACGNLWILKDGKIDVNQRGYAAYNGPGAPTLDRRGGSHAGFGGRNPALPYGNAETPEAPGSGGSGAGHAGGAVRVTATNRIVINGSITANGTYANLAGTSQWGSGSGGSIWLEGRTLAGTNGLVSANAGSIATASHNSGSGSGGRIAVTYLSSAQDALPSPDIIFSAAPGQREATFTSMGDLGTLYFPDNRLMTSPFRHTGRWKVHGVDSWVTENLHVDGARIRFPEPGFVLVATNDLTVTGNHLAMNGLELFGGNVHVGGDVVIRGASLTLFDDDDDPSELDVAGNLAVSNAAATVVGGGVLEVHASVTNATTPWGGTVRVGGHLHITPYSTVYPVSHSENGGSVFFSVRDLTVSAGGAISANHRGFAPYQGPGALSSGTHWGGSHGGMGDKNTLPAYGSSNAPAFPGSGGAGYGWGGGVVRVTARTITLDGAITADGTYSKDPDAALYGSGAGGSVWLDCDTLAGNAGVITANGGDVSPASDTSGTGAGGRIAIWRRFDQSSSLDAVARGGLPGNTTNIGQDGTVVWGTIPPKGTMILVR